MKIRAFVCLLALLLTLAVAAFAAPTATIVLNWTASTTTTPAVTYQIYRETEPGICTPTTTGAGPRCLLLNATPQSGTTYTDTGVSTAATIWYVVRAVNINGNSGYSNEVKVTFTVQSPPAAPTNLVCNGTAQNVAPGESVLITCQ